MKTLSNGTNTGQNKARSTATKPKAPPPNVDNALHHLLPALLVTVVSVIALGIVYPVAVWAVGALLFHHQADGSHITVNGKVIGSELVGQTFKKPQYFHGRPSAAGKDGYDPTSTGGTNFGPTSKKLVEAVRSASDALRKENPASTGPVPPELITSSASGVDPDISPEGAYYQVPRVAKARNLSVDVVRDLVRAHVRDRQLGILGEPRVNVLELNRALDERHKGV